MLRFSLLFCSILPHVKNLYLTVIFAGRFIHVALGF